MAEFNVPEVNASGEFVSPLVKSHVQKLAKAYTDERVDPTELGKQHLDTVEEPGDYMQSENAEALTETGYPVPIAGSLTVAANRTRNMVLQQYRTYRAIENGRTWSRARYLGNWSAWAESGGSALPAGGTTGQVLTKTSDGSAWADGPLANYPLTGPGRPDQVATTQGAITGSEPVGTTYTSTDGANVGAYVWRKRPGGKWEVTDGDTGPRSLKGRVNVTHSSAGHDFTLRRIGRVVYLTATFQAVETAPKALGGTPLNAPPTPGFNPVTPLYLPLRTHTVAESGVLYVETNGLRSYAATATGMSFAPSLSWATAEAWPTTLPGTPA